MRKSKKAKYGCEKFGGKAGSRKPHKPINHCKKIKCRYLVEEGTPVFGPDRRAHGLASRRALSEPGAYSTVVPGEVDEKLRAALGMRTKASMRKEPRGPVQLTPEQEIIREKQRLINREHQQQERGTGRKKGSKKKRTDRGRHGGRKRRKARH